MRYFLILLVLIAFSSNGFTKEIPKEDKECLECHKKKDSYYGSYRGEARPLFVDYDSFKKTKHGKNFKCIDCHKGFDIKEVDPKTKKLKISAHLRSYERVMCEDCHTKKGRLVSFLKKRKIKMPKEKLVDEYPTSYHGMALKKENPYAPYCTDCHGGHGDLFGKNNKNSWVNHSNLRKTCGRCHGRHIGNDMSFWTRFALFRIKAHEKGDFSKDYYDCINCHQGDVIHGKKISQERCIRCHDVNNPEVAIKIHEGYNLSDIRLLFIFSAYGVVLSALIGLIAFIIYGGKKEERNEE